MKTLLTAAILTLLMGCTQSMEILEGATHAKGSVHIEGPLTDSQADVDLCKVPDDYTVEQAIAYCSNA